MVQAYERLGDTYQPLRVWPKFYVTSYEDLSLGDHLGLFDPWEHEHFDRKTGEYTGVVRNIRGGKCECGGMRKSVLPDCPRCGKPWRGENAGGGRVCRHCGHVAWTMGQAPRRPLPEVPAGSPEQAKKARRERIEALRELRMASTDKLPDEGPQNPIWAMTRRAYMESKALRAGGVPICNVRDGQVHERIVREAVAAGRPVPARVLIDYPELQQQAESYRSQVELDDEGPFISTYNAWPLGNRIQALFPCVILDEAQDAKSKLSLRGAASRGLRSRNKAILTGTWMKGYCHDLFWTAGWLLGFGSPLWPFPYRGGSGRFLDQFGTYQYVTREYKDTLEVGKRKLIPSVSNLGRLWKLLSPVAVRRLKEDFLQDLPPKHTETHWLEPSGSHESIVRRVADEMKRIFQVELRKADPSMGRISMALWWGRYAASCPNKYGALHYAGAWGHRVNDEASAEHRRAIMEEMRQAGALVRPSYRFCKVQKTLEIILAAREAGDKVIVFTSLRGLYCTLEEAFKDKCIRYVGMDGVPTKKRNARVRQFENSAATVLLAGTGTLNRGVTINGANHVIILNLEWSPETTLQASDRCHRPGQTKEVYVHYILCTGTVDEQMYELVEQKAAAQRAVQDREAQNQTVEEILAQAAQSNAKLAVARAVIEQGFRRQGISLKEASEKAEEAVREMERRLVFGQSTSSPSQRRRKKQPAVAVRYVGTLFDQLEETEGQTKPAEPAEKSDGPTQLAMFPM